MVNLHRRYRLTTTQLAAATEDRFSDGSGLSSGSGSITMPHEEVRDYFYQRQNYLHELDTAAEDLTIRMRMHRGDLARELVRPARAGARRAHRQPHRPRRQGAAPLRPATRTLEISNHLSSGQQVFKMAAELAYLEFGDLIDKLVDEGKFTSDESRTLARLGLANYFAAATVLPYRQFHEVAENVPLRRRAALGVLLGQLRDRRHRLSTLQRPSMRGVPFSFVRVDRAGNMSKRQSATGFHFSSSGGTCPLWNVYETFANPGKILRADRPDARRPQLHVGGAHRRAPRRRAMVSRARRSRSAWAANCGTRTGSSTRRDWTCPVTIATPIGAGCRVCERDNCPQRAFPALGRALDLDEHRSTVSPYLVKQS